MENRKVAPTDMGATLSANANRNDAADYFSLMTVVVLVELPTVPSSSQTLVWRMRSSASTRLVNAIGPICVTTSRSAGRVVVMVQRWLGPYTM